MIYVVLKIKMYIFINILGKGSAVLFYNLLEDGNSDDLALHEARPVKEGEKWLANYWIWDPARK